jgi:hypothetical protein
MYSTYTGSVTLQNIVDVQYIYWVSDFAEHS